MHKEGPGLPGGDASLVIADLMPHFVHRRQDVRGAARPRYDNEHIVWSVIILVVLPNLLDREGTNVGHDAACLHGVAARPRVQELAQGNIGYVPRFVFNCLHLREYDTFLLAVAIDMIDLGDEAARRNFGSQHMIKEYWQKRQRPFTPRRRQRVGRVVYVGVGVGA